MIIKKRVSQLKYLEICIFFIAFLGTTFNKEAVLHVYQLISKKCFFIFCHIL